MSGDVLAETFSLSFLDSLNSGDDLEEAVTPEALTAELFSFQKQGLQFMLNRERHGNPAGGILADEMGLGKSIQMAALILANPRPVEEIQPGQYNGGFCKGTLIVAPVNLLEQWKDELAQHAPLLSIETFSGTPAAIRWKGDDASYAAELDEIAARLATKGAAASLPALPYTSNLLTLVACAADVVLVSYEVLTRECKLLQYRPVSVGSARPQRGAAQQARELTHQQIAFGVSKTSSVKVHPSPLQKMGFWRIVLDEVQKAPGGRAAGVAVRAIISDHRWAVSGTPMEPKQPSDLTHLIGFVTDYDGDAYHNWVTGLTNMRKRGKGAVDVTLGALRPILLRRMKAPLAHILHIARVLEPVHKVFNLSPQEQAMQSEFVLPVVINEYDTGIGASAGGTGLGLAGWGAAQQKELVEAVQRSLLAPQLYVAWGVKSFKGIDQRRTAKRAMQLDFSKAAASYGKQVAVTLVGELIRHDLSTLEWDPLLAAARSELNKKANSLRQLVLGQLSREYRASDG